MLRAIRVVINSIGFVLLAIMTYVMWDVSPPLAIVFAMAAFDQFEDVYTYTYNKRLFPPWMRVADIIFEMVMFGIGFALFFFAFSYYAYFQTWFFKALFPLSIMIMYSSIEDIFLWRTSEQSSYEGGIMSVRPKETLRKKTFVKKKY